MKKKQKSLTQALIFTPFYLSGYVRFAINCLQNQSLCYLLSLEFLNCLVNIINCFYWLAFSSRTYSFKVETLSCYFPPWFLGEMLIYLLSNRQIFAVTVLFTVLLCHCFQLVCGHLYYLQTGFKTSNSMEFSSNRIS